ncbi:MAG: hypothetical protein ABR910_03765 [Acidobacteriaceae bacterium]
MAMELVRSAPGVAAMSAREMRVVGVTVSTLARSRLVVTVTLCETWPSWSWKWRMGAVSEWTVRGCWRVAKPERAMVTV